MVGRPADTTIGERIAALRRERGLSQARLAEATGVSRSAVAQWETDRAGQYSGHLARIAQALDVSVELLLHGHDARSSGGLSSDELALLRLYRLCSPDLRSEILRTVRKCARESQEPTASASV